MNNIYLLDTNILIYYFNNDPSVQPIFEEIQVGDVIGLWLTQQINAIFTYKKFPFAGIYDSNINNCDDGLYELACLFSAWRIYFEMWTLPSQPRTEKTYSSNF